MQDRRWHWLSREFVGVLHTCPGACRAGVPQSRAVVTLAEVTIWCSLDMECSARGSWEELLLFYKAVFRGGASGN